METQNKLRQDYLKTQDPRNKEELLRIADAYDVGYKTAQEHAHHAIEEVWAKHKTYVTNAERIFATMEAKLTSLVERLADLTWERESELETEIDHSADASKEVDHSPQAGKLVDG